MGAALLLAGLGVTILALGTPPAAAGEPAPPLATAHSNGPPPGYTGGFAEPTCLVCHSGFALGLDGSLEFGDLPESYEAGKVYRVTLILHSTEMRKAGFQASARFAAGDDAGRQAGVLRALDHRASIVSSPDDPSIHYVQHMSQGTDVIDRKLAKWTFEWTAPRATSDPVVFHASANSANGDASPLGDLVYATRSELTAAAADGP